MHESAYVLGFSGRLTMLRCCDGLLTKTFRALDWLGAAQIDVARARERECAFAQKGKPPKTQKRSQNRRPAMPTRTSAATFTRSMVVQSLWPAHSFIHSFITFRNSGPRRLVRSFDQSATESTSTTQLSDCPRRVRVECPQNKELMLVLRLSHASCRIDRVRCVHYRP